MGYAYHVMYAKENSDNWLYYSINDTPEAADESYLDFIREQPTGYHCEIIKYYNKDKDHEETSNHCSVGT